VIHNLLSKVDALLIGGGMAYTFLKAKGQDVGKSLVEADKLEWLVKRSKKPKKGVRFLLPVDHVLADKFAADARTRSSRAMVRSLLIGWRST
jgi:phosphoglycerate kinase